jgi:hypothetical protein
MKRANRKRNPARRRAKSGRAGSGKTSQSGTGGSNGNGPSDHDVIMRFVGDYVSDGKIQASSDPDKVSYYPGKGVKLTLRKCALSATEAYAKIRIDRSGAQWGGARALERAIFRVEGKRLVAKDIELGPGTLLKETLEMNEDGSMNHRLEFSDDQHGSWICKP